MQGGVFMAAPSTDLVPASAPSGIPIASLRPFQNPREIAHLEEVL